MGMSTELVRTQVGEVQVRRGGSGEVLVYLHSANGEGEGLVVLDELSRHFDVVAPMFPGFGESEGITEIDDMDDAVDDLHVDYIQAIFETHERGSVALQNAVQLALVGRFYERIGDHAVNIGERVRYMVTGWLPEHAGAARQAVRDAGVEGTVEGSPLGDGARLDDGA